MRTRLLLLVPLVLGLVGCSAASKIDYLRVFTRAGWQLPDRVIEALELTPGARVADLGAGEGYFTFRLAEAVGPEGTVYAVELDEELVAELREEVRERGVGNVVVVQATPEDPQLPDGSLDLVFLCNVYHHIQDRSPYFERLHADLAAGGRVAIVDTRDDDPVARFLVPKHHWVEGEIRHAEMRDARYVPRESFDFLPLQSFEVYVPSSGGPRSQAVR